MLIRYTGQPRRPGLSQATGEADVVMDQPFQARAGAIIEEAAVELEGDGHVPHDRVAQMAGKQHRCRRHWPPA